MYGNKKGFTLIEVALFLAVTGALFAAIMGGVQNSIFQQRINDSTQSFMEFLKTAYSETMNVQSLGYGRSNMAIYGKLITFNEEYALDGARFDDGDNRNRIYMYDVFGDIKEDGIGAPNSVTKALKDLNAHVIREEDGKKVLNGIVETYTPKWGAAIQNSKGQPFSGSLLIIRHPNSGVIYTFYSTTTIPVNGMRLQTEGGVPDIGWNSFEINSDGNINFCINPTPESSYPNRPNVRIVAGSRSGSGIELVPESDQEYACEWEGN